MLRILAGIIVGFIIMFVLVIATFGIAIAAVGLDHLLQPNSYWTTDTFNVIVLIGGFIAAIIGGMVCSMIARSSLAVYTLAAITLAMGIGSAAMNMNKPDPPVRTGPPTMTDMQTHGKEPNWFAISKAVMAPIGLLIGSRLISRKTRDQQGT